MAWSFPVARIAGTRIWIHATFVLLLVWMAVVLAGGASIARLGFLPLLLLCVILHEAGHVAMAAHFGIHAHDIVLLPMGGIEACDAIPENPARDIAIALAGSAVSLGLGVLFVALSGRSGVLFRIGITNLALGGFNLIPAPPMDGGRVLRALLTPRLGQVRAAWLTAGAGRATALGFSLLGVGDGNALLVLVGLFLFMAANESASA